MLPSTLRLIGEAPPPRRKILSRHAPARPLAVHLTPLDGDLGDDGGEAIFGEQGGEASVSLDYAEAKGSST